MDNLIKRNIICIDLKSFFASAECVDRNLDPFTTPLVVADPTRGNGAITLAVTPYLKNLGVKSRCRLYEIPKTIKYTIARPRMSLYINKAREVINVYLDFISKEDMHIYSIDEVFLDVTSYLFMYKKTVYELAQTIIDEVYNRTKLTVTAGIGENMLMAKLAMDIEAKHNKSNIAMWTYDDIKTKLWEITPLSKMWGIGINMEKKLNNLGIYKIGDLALYDKNKIIKKFGVMGQELHEHANGVDNSIIKDFETETKEKSINHSQILFKDYYNDNINLIISEMIDVLLVRLRSMKCLTKLVSFGIGYSKVFGGGFYHSMKLNRATNNHKDIYDICLYMFDKYYEENSPIRKVSISFGKLEDNSYIQLTLFEDANKLKKRRDMEDTIDNINSKFGKNAVLKANSLLSDSTIKMRNKKIGGHSS